MTILEFIKTQYPIRDRVKELLADPYKRIAEMDDLPYDKIGMDENGIITKLVEVDDSRDVSVMDLISYTEEDLIALRDSPLSECWKAYMENVDIHAVNLVDIMQCARDYKAIAAKRKEQLDVLSVQES